MFEEFEISLALLLLASAGSLFELDAAACVAGGQRPLLSRYLIAMSRQSLKVLTAFFGSLLVDIVA